MLFIRAYSWTKLKKKTTRLIILSALIFLMYFIYTSHWNEVAVFRVLKEEVVLAISPSTPSRVYINKEEISEQRLVDAKTPYLLKINTDESIYVGTVPDSDQLPVEKKLIFKDGELYIPEEKDFWEDLTINEWPNQVFEILIHPKNLVKDPIKPVRKIIMEGEVDFDGNGIFENIRIIQQGENYFMEIDYYPITTLKNYKEDGFKWVIRDVNEDGIMEIIIKGPLDQTYQYIEIYQYQDKKMERVFKEYGENIQVHPNGNIKIEKRLYDIVDHYSQIQYKWLENKYEKIQEKINWWQESPKWPQTPHKTIEAFLQAYELGLQEEAKGYLIKKLQTSKSLESMMSGVQKGWISIGAPKYYFLATDENEEIYKAFYYKSQLHPNYNRVKIYNFKLKNQASEQGAYKIKKIN